MPYQADSKPLNFYPKTKIVGHAFTNVDFQSLSVESFFRNKII